MHVGRVVGLGGAAGLAGLAALHVAWGRGSSFPFATKERFNDAVVGADVTPPALGTYAVAAALSGAAGLLATATTGHGRVARTGSGAVAIGLGVRAAFGLAGRTDVLVPGSDSETFRRLDRRFFAPPCLALGASAAWAAVEPPS